MTLSLTYKHPKESDIVNLLCDIAKSEVQRQLAQATIGD